MQTNIKKLTSVISASIIALSAGMFFMMSSVSAAPKQPGSSTIASIAATDGRFTTLVAALQCTGLLGLVDGTTNRQLTVFAPTDDAFAKVAGGLNADNICEAIPTADLAGILAYHVTPGIKDSKTVLNRSSMNMLSRQKAPIVGATIGGAALNTDLLNLRASNGMIHVVNDVMMPAM